MSVRKALSFAFLDRYASLVVGIGASMVLARLLTPAEVAVFSIVTVMLGFLSTVRELGTGQYLVRTAELDAERIRAVWAVQLGLGALIAGVVAGGAAPLATLYNEPRMRDVMLVLAFNYLVNPWGSLTQAWLTREMRFESIAFARFFSTVAGALLSIGLAWRGQGPISLALGSLASTVVNAALLLPLRPHFFPWLPGLHGVRQVISFGGPLTGAHLLWTVAKGAPEMLLGRLQSLTAAGLYARASGLVEIFHRLVTDIVHGVALSWFAQEARQQGNFSRSFVKATGHVTAIGWTFCLTIAFLAHPVIAVLFGPQWTAAVGIARVLAGAMVFGVPVTLCFAALVAAGAVTRAFQASAASTGVTLVLVGAGASFGLLETGWASMAAAAFDAALFMALTRRCIGFDWADLRAALLRSAMVAVCAALGPALAWLALGSEPATSWPSLAVGLPGAAAGFTGAVFAFGHPLRDEMQLLWRRAWSRRES